MARGRGRQRHQGRHARQLAPENAQVKHSSSWGGDFTDEEADQIIQQFLAGEYGSCSCFFIGDLEDPCAVGSTHALQCEAFYETLFTDELVQLEAESKATLSLLEAESKASHSEAQNTIVERKHLEAADENNILGALPRCIEVHIDKRKANHLYAQAVSPSAEQQREAESKAYQDAQAFSPSAERDFEQHLDYVTGLSLGEFDLRAALLCDVVQGLADDSARFWAQLQAVSESAA